MQPAHSVHPIIGQQPQSSGSPGMHPTSNRILINPISTVPMMPRTSPSRMQAPTRMNTSPNPLSPPNPLSAPNPLVSPSSARQLATNQYYFLPPPSSHIPLNAPSTPAIPTNGNPITPILSAPDTFVPHTNEITLSENASQGQARSQM